MNAHDEPVVVREATKAKGTLIMYPAGFVRKPRKLSPMEAAARNWKLEG